MDDMRILPPILNFYQELLDLCCLYHIFSRYIFLLIRVINVLVCVKLFFFHNCFGMSKEML